MDFSEVTRASLPLPATVGLGNMFLPWPPKQFLATGGGSTNHFKGQLLRKSERAITLPTATDVPGKGRLLIGT